MYISITDSAVAGEVKDEAIKDIPKENSVIKEEPLIGKEDSIVKEKEANKKTPAPSLSKENSMEECLICGICQVCKYTQWVLSLTQLV